MKVKGTLQLEDFSFPLMAQSYHWKYHAEVFFLYDSYVDPPQQYPLRLHTASQCWQGTSGDAPTQPCVHIDLTLVQAVHIFTL